MDRREAILRELNIYPLWKLREQSAPGKVQGPVVGHLTEPIEPTILEAVSQDEAVVFREPVQPQSGWSNLNWPELKQQVSGCTACKLRSGCPAPRF